MKMYVANVTEQVFDFRYRLPEVSKPRALSIPPRAQVRLPDDMNQQQMDAVVAQHAPYGFTSVEQVSASNRAGRKISLCYGVDRPVPGVRMELLYRNNYEAAVKDGEKTRKETAVASSLALVNTVDEQTRNTELAGVADRTRNFMTEVIEEESPDNSDATRLAESYKVTASATPAKAGGGKRGRR